MFTLRRNYRFLPRIVRINSVRYEMIFSIMVLRKARFPGSFCMGKEMILSQAADMTLVFSEAKTERDDKIQDFKIFAPDTSKFLLIRTFRALLKKCSP